MEVNGYTLALDNGNLHVIKDSKLIMATKGDPREKGNPPFADLNKAAEYFGTTGYAQPPVDADPDAPIATDVDPAV